MIVALASYSYLQMPTSELNLLTNVCAQEMVSRHPTTPLYPIHRHRRRSSCMALVKCLFPTIHHDAARSAQQAAHSNMPRVSSALPASPVCRR